MHVLLTLLLPAFLLLTPGSDLKKPETKCYYFCISRTIVSSQATGKVLIKFTDIREMNNDESLITEKAQEWGSFINTSCKAAEGCTSDLNYYPTEEAAISQLNTAKKRYSDPEKFVIEKVTFEKK